MVRKLKKMPKKTTKKVESESVRLRQNEQKVVDAFTKKNPPKVLSTRDMDRKELEDLLFDPFPKEFQHLVVGSKLTKSKGK